MGGRRKGLALALAFACLLSLACGDDAIELVSSASPPPRPAIAFVRDSALYTVEPDGSSEKLVAEGAFLPAWSPDGKRIAFFAPPFGVSTGRSTRPAFLNVDVVDTDGRNRVRVTEGLMAESGVQGFAWSPDSRSLAIAAEGQIYLAQLEPLKLRRLTTEDQGDLGSPAPGTQSISWSPDGRRIAFTNGGVNLIDADGGGLSRIGGGCGDAVAWSPLGDALAVACDRRSLYVIDADGTDRRDLGGELARFDRLNSFAWSPDGRHVVVDGQRVLDWWLVEADGSAVETPAKGRSPSWSRDGRIAYACASEGWQLCILDRETGASKQITDSSLGTIDAFGVVWSPAP